MQNLPNYNEFSREEWKHFHGEYNKQAITNSELA
jgi:hypothetical protein